jgi:hypothetical protein
LKQNDAKRSEKNGVFVSQKHAKMKRNKLRFTSFRFEAKKGHPSGVLQKRRYNGIQKFVYSSLRRMPRSNSAQGKDDVSIESIRD